MNILSMVYCFAGSCLPSIATAKAKVVGAFGAIMTASVVIQLKENGDNRITEELLILARPPDP
ncbi:hypothetical protein H5410_061216 [Solanum commersonii]|uniref:Uncharacterized protein n=1 Tax=Solanum commersonii TaxID=4109 RepID=A0A9J5W7D9_SOLCO|nr:hypothetical protein H5410_061216 [Solanum commersonii]